MHRSKRNWTTIVVFSILVVVLVALIGLYETRTTQSLCFEADVVCSGILHVVIASLGHVNPFGSLPTQLQILSYVSTRRTDVTTTPRNVTDGVLPIPCHSHNDYLRREPLFDALRVGCTSVEADVWLSDDDDDDEELLVGHKKSSLRQSRTLRSLYLRPLLDLLESRNGSIFDNDTLVLLLDFKSDGVQLLPYVEERLQPLREKNCTTLRNGLQGPLTIVASGNGPSNLPEDIFLDADLSNLESSNTSTAYYASASLSKALGSPVLGRLSPKQRAKMREQVQEAHERGLKARCWDTPSWPVSRRNWFWETLVEEGVDVLNVDDLTAAAWLDWGFVRWGWFDG